VRAQVYVSCHSYRRAATLLVASVAVLLSGCWVPPSATVRPGGSPRVIADGIVVERVAEPATVAAVDRSARTLALSMPGVALATYGIGRGVPDWGDIRVGDRVRATIRQDLTVYVAPAGESAGARVLVVDPSYRVLTVRYPNGRTETFKIGLHTRMQGMEAGDSVTIRPLDVIRLRVR
jgi:hypothetical protein